MIGTFARWSKEDVKELAEIERVTFSSPWSEWAIESEIRNSIFCGETLKVDGKIVGYFGFLRILDEGHILNIAVRPEERGKGYGTAIMQRMTERAREFGLSRMTLEVRASNAVAIHLYQNFGFAEEGKRPNFYDDGETALILWMTL